MGRSCARELLKLRGHEEHILLGEVDSVLRRLGRSETHPAQSSAKDLSVSIALVDRHLLRLGVEQEEKSGERPSSRSRHLVVSCERQCRGFGVIVGELDVC
jgi:hypothetical protein